MAKEMMITFVYDMQLLKREEDDPASAILYFHPGWVSDLQKTALCGQIMGTLQFLKALFTCPKIIALQSGKFIIREYGRYILAVGTDRNVADWVLEYRADTLTSLITFFHNDLEVMRALYETTPAFSAKLYYMLETYIKILTYSSNLFSNIPKIQLPKSASNVFLESIQILQSCQEVEGVLGGIMLYHNKVLSTQLSCNLTKRLVLTDPYRIKSPAEVVAVDYQLPIGVQLLQVYVDVQDYEEQREDAMRARNVHLYVSKKSFSKSQPSKEQVLTAMKRDQSIIFSTVPEEDAEAHSPINIESNIMPTCKLKRPKFLNLRNKTSDVENKSNAIASTPFHGTSSICSTPLTDLNKVLYHDVMSICIDPEKPAKSAWSIEENEDNELHDEGCNSNWDNSDISSCRVENSSSEGFQVTSTSSESDVDCKHHVNDDWKSVESFEYSPKNSSRGRSSLTLPLKSLSFDAESGHRCGGGVQLTPLMSKLSLLGMEECSSGFGSKDATPNDYKDILYTPSHPNYNLFKGTTKQLHKQSIETRKKCILFVCGQQDMVVALLLEDDAQKSSKTINELWDICVESLGKVEKQLRHCLETYSGGSSSDESSDPYSYLSMDQNWDTIHRGGPWGCSELGALTHLHRDFNDSINITEITLRDDDCLIYGNRSGKSEVYYMQAANGTTGLPPPTDPMATVALKARKRLERDQAIILL